MNERVQIAAGSRFLGNPPAVWKWVILAAILGIGAWLRLHDLSADPPLGLTWSHALYTDGARIVEGARTRVLWGRWEMDPEHPVVLYYPLSSAVAYGIFRAFGVGLWQANLTGAIPGILALVLLFGLGSRRSVWVGVAAGLLGALNYFSVVYNRLPLSESLMLLLMLAVPALLVREPLRWWGALLAGLALAAAAFFVKFHALVLLPVTLVWLAWFRRDPETTALSAGRSMGFFLGGLALGVIVWLGVFFIPSPGAVGDFLRHNLISQYGQGEGGGGIGGFLGDRVAALVGLGTNVRFFGRMPVVGFVALLTALGFVMNRRSRQGPLFRVESFFALWFLGAIVALSLLDYRPLRYHLQLVPPMVILCGVGLARLLEGSAEKAGVRGGGSALWVFFFSVFAGYQVLLEVPVLMGRHGPASGALLSALGMDPRAVFGRLARFVNSPSMVLFVAVLVSAAVLALYLWARRRGGRTLFAAPFGVRAVLVAVLLALSVLIDAGLLAGGPPKARHSMRDASDDLGRILGEGGLLVGTTATTLTLENRLQSIPSYGLIMKKGDVESFRRHPITHILLREGTLNDFLKEHFPDVFDRAVFLRRYVIGPSESSLLWVEGWPGTEAYRPTAYERGMKLLAGGDPGAAAVELRGFLEKEPEEPSALFALGICMERMDRAEEGIGLMERAVSRAPDDVALLNDLAASYARAGRLGEAVGLLRRVLVLNPDDPRAHAYMDTLRRGLQTRSDQPGS